MRGLCYIAVCALLLLAAGAEAKSPPPGAGAADVPANILLMMDTSGSMSEIITEGDTRYPVDIAYDSNGNAFIAKQYDEVEIYNASGNYVTVFGGYGNSNGKFDMTFAVAVDHNDNVYVTDYNHGRVQKFTTSGTYVSKFNLHNGGPAQGIAVDSSNNVYVVNGSGDVEKFNSSGTYQSTLNTPSGTKHIAIDGSNVLYIADYSSSRYRKYTTAGVLQSTVNLAFKPYGITVDASGNVYVTAVDNDRIYKYSPAGAALANWGGSGSGVGQFRAPHGLEKDNSGNIYVADYNNSRIQGLTGTLPLQAIAPQTRLQAMQAVVKSIVSDSELTGGAHFGLMSWNSNATMKVNASSTGANTIYTTVDTLTAGGSTMLDNAMNLASSYFLGVNSPMDPNTPCQKNILIVVSDGQWVDTTASTTAKSLYDNHGIQTFAVGFQTTADANYINLSQKGGTYPDSPLFADNQQNLLDVLSNYIKQIISSQLSFSAPTIMPGVTGGDYLLQSTFSYKKSHQWKGHLYKYALQEDGTLGNTLWDAGDLLNNIAADNRKLWTVGNGITAGLNNFTTANLARLRAPLNESAGSPYTDPQLTSLINFVRGKDSYSEYPSGKDDENTAFLTGERWKLADVYHSRTVVAGSPSATVSDEASAESETYYRFANGYTTFKNSAACGGSCATRKEMVYVGANDGTLHAINSATGVEEWAFIPPSLVPSLKDMIAITAATSTSIYGVDGTPTVKDIFYGGAWHTVLMCGLRQGGASYFALDVTNPDSPQHLFTLASFPTRNLLSYWDATGTRTDYPTASPIPAAFDFRKLGEAWSQPVITSIKIGGTRKWVAVLGGGYNSGNNPNYGAQLFVLDMENGGQILQNLTVADGDGTNSIVNAVPPRVTAITADSTALFQYAGALVYFADLEGKLWKVNLTDQGTLYDMTRLFNAEATSANDRYSYQELTATITPDNRLIHYFGTADIQNIGKTGASIQNRAYGIYDQNFPTYTSVSPFTVTTLQNQTAGASCPTAIQNGWYLNLGTDEKVSGRMAVGNNTVFIPRYKPDSSLQCEPGTATLTEQDFVCGNTIRTTNLGAGMPTEVVVYKNKLYIGVSNNTADSGILPQGFTKQGNLIIGNPAQTGTGTVRIESWKEDF